MLNRVGLDDALINFYADSTGTLNLDHFINNLSPPDTTKTAPSEGKPLGLEFKNISIENSRFRLASYNPQKLDYGINFEDLDVKDLNIDVRNLNISGDTIAMLINSLIGVEKSGFKIDKLRAEFSLCSKHLNFDKLRIKAEGSNLQLPYLHMTFDGMDKMSRFLKEVMLDIKFDNSFIKSNTLAYIIPDIRNYDFDAIVNGKVIGTISDLRGKNLVITTGTQTRIATNCRLTGLPDIEQTMMIIDVKELSTSAKDLAQIKQRDNNQPLIGIPSSLEELNKITYKGNFTGFINNFVAYGTISSSIGKLSLDLSIKPDTTQTTEFNGNVSTTNLDLGKLTGTSSLGRISFAAKVKGNSDKNSNISAFTDATINQLEAYKYTYSNIKINGNLTKSTYIGSIFLDDPNCKLNFLGKLDFTDTIPVFDFTALVPKIDFVKLNLNTVDSISQASFLFTAKFSGNNLDNSKGEIKIVNSSYKNQNGEFMLSDITINADNNKDSKLISLQSEFAEGELRSKYNYSNIFENLEKLLYIYVPALKSEEKQQSKPSISVENPEFNDYIVKFRLKKTKKITEVLTPDFRIAENTSVFGIFNPDLKTLSLKVKIPELSIGTNVFKDISIDGQTKDSIFEANLTIPVFNMGSSYIRNISLNTITNKNKVDLSFGWDNKQTPVNSGKINALMDFSPSALHNGSKANIFFKQSAFTINDSVWSISPSSINLDSSKIAINKFNVHNQQQSLSFTGNISSNPTDSIELNLENIDVSNLNFYLKSLGYELNGRIDGEAKVTGIYTNPTLFADIGINNFFVNKREVGDIKFKSTWYNAEKKLSINLNNLKHDSITFDVNGDIYTETNKLDFNINFPQVQLNHFSPILDGVVSSLSGKVYGNLKLTGTTKKPLLNGTLNINQGKFVIDFMKAPYTINDKVVFKNSDIIFNDFKILDKYKHVATVNGSVKSGYFSDFNLNLNIAPNNFQCINTTERDNELFYGTVYATGLVAITGKPDKINMNIAVKTDNKTILYLPLSSSGEVVENNFITYTNNNPDDIFIEEIAPVKQESSTDMNLTFDLQVTPEAEVQIIIDKKLGDIIKANGSGNLKMEVNPNKDLFKIYGDYNIEKGDYLFTLQGVINKKFKIEDGSTLSWNGDPTDATVNIKATYKVKTALNQLLADYTGRFDNRVPVDCQILLTQKLMSPGIKFNIDVPNVDNETKALVESALNTEDNINRQFLSLLIINSFLPPTGVVSTGTTQQETSTSSLGSGFSKNTLSEMLSNQLSNWLSQWSKSFDIGINYRPGSTTTTNNLSSDQVELAVSTQLLDDRVSLNGNVNMATRNNNNPIAGDFSLDIKLNKTGKLRFKAFARSNDEIMTSTSEQTYTTGAGIVYREEFNNFKDLLHRIRYTFKQEPIVVPYKEPQQLKEVKDTTKISAPEKVSFLIIK